MRKKFRQKLLLKIDSDGQMDPKNIPQLIEPIKNKTSDFTKGIDLEISTFW